MESSPRLSDFGYTLPEELIAQHPLSDRTQARMMVIDRARQCIVHDCFYNLGKYLPSQSLIVVNNTKVVPARLHGKREPSGGNVEIFVLSAVSRDGTYHVLMRPLRRIKTGDRFSFADGKLKAEVIDRERRIVKFNRPDVAAYLQQIGHIPLPPYIKREDVAQDRRDYQTVYARYAGSVAAPTAGMHFSKKLLEALAAAGHEIVSVLLHINYATFKPVQVEDIAQHVMHREQYAVTQHAWQRIVSSSTEKRPVMAVGTTACRVIESVARTQRLRGSTDLFLYPGKTFHMTDMLLTNFHLPQSTLLMLVHAFGSQRLMRRAYQEAIEHRYRFYSYGDAMLIV